MIRASILVVMSLAAACLLRINCFAQDGSCGVPVPGEVFCDDFGPDSHSRWNAGDDTLTIENGLGRVSGVGVPTIWASGVVASDVSIQAVGRVVEGESLGIAARADVGVNYYIGIGENDQGTSISMSKGGGVLEHFHEGTVSFSPFEILVAMQLDVIGDQLSYRIWPADQPMPAEPIATVTDTRAESGGVFAGAISPPPFTGPAAADFVYFRVATQPITQYVPIPEPSTFALTGLGLLGLAAQRRRRRM